MYRLDFDTEDAYQAMKEAFRRDTGAMGFEQPRIRFNDSSKQIELDYNMFEMLIFFEGKEKEVGKLLPLSWESPTGAALSNACQGKPFRITREGGNIEDAFAHRCQEASDYMRPWNDAPSEPKSNLDGKTIDALLADAQKSVVLGEWHANPAPRRYLIENMDAIARSRKPLILEHAFRAQQPQIDAWLAAPDDAPMPGELKATVEFFSNSFEKGAREMGGPSNGAHSFMDLFHQAKKSRVRIIALEDELSMMGLMLGDLNQRILLMNRNAHEVAAGAPFNALVGAVHAVDIHGDTGMFIPGIARMGNGVSTVLADSLALYPRLPADKQQEFKQIAHKADFFDLNRTPPEETEGRSNDRSWASQFQKSRSGCQQSPPPNGNR